MARQRKRHDNQDKNVQSQSASVHLRGLKKWDEIPSWQQDNEYILSGYREPAGSFARCLRSIAYVHNETVNIYSHLIGAAIFSTMPVYFYKSLHSSYLQATRAEMIVFSTFFYGVAICFLLSST